MQINKDEIRKGKRVMDTVTGNIGVLADIQEAHDRYQLTNVSGWQYGIKNLIPYDAKDETIRQQAAEIERLKGVEHTLCLAIGAADEAIGRLRKERDELREARERTLLYERQAVIRYNALRECLEWYADKGNNEWDIDSFGEITHSEIMKDEGLRARTLLAELDRKDTQPVITLRPAVQWFAEQMERVLRDNDHKGGWKDCERDFLLQRLESNYHDLYGKLRSYGECFDAENAIRKAVNVANFAMMIADNARREESEPIYVFQLNEYDAVAAKWLDDAIEWYKATTGLPDEDIYPYDDIEALPPDYKVQGAETGEMVLLYDIVRRDWKGEPFIACSTEW